MASELIRMPGGGLPTEPPEEREPPSLADWLKRNNAPKCLECWGTTVATGEQNGNGAEFACVRSLRNRKQRKRQKFSPNDCLSRWVNIRPLSQAEREE